MATAPKSEILHIAELVSYQNGSLWSAGRSPKWMQAMSPSLLSTRTRSLSEHAAPVRCIVHVLEGDAEVRILRQSLPFETGDAIVMPANEPHALKAIDPFQNAADDDSAIDRKIKWGAGWHPAPHHLLVSH